MKVLVVNAGSSSVKFQVFAMGKEMVLAKGLVERVGTDQPLLKYKRHDGVEHETTPEKNDHVGALQSICACLTDKKIGIVKKLSEIEAIGHRIVHGGERATKPALITHLIKEIIRDCYALAPLHNPANLAGIEACEKAFPGVPNVAVFDTAFHQSMPPESFLYAVPYELYTKYAIRRYGFHGTSHNFVAKAAGSMLGMPYERLKLITCHLGNGCSIAAIDHGVVIDTSMGMTPLEGLMMGTRSGDLDPAVVLRLFELGKTPAEIDKMLNKESGLLGVAGIGSSDMRDIIAAEEKGDQQAQRARRMFTRRVVKYIGAYYALLGGADAIIFCGGVGEWSQYSRAKIVRKLNGLGIELDEKINQQCSGVKDIISSPRSSCKVLVIPTNEELMIARSVVTTVTNDEVPALPRETAKHK
ncbi:MAG: acetate kinase [Victivallaceae bacterium]|nr:acetate kinase [Victivallaceae bacterium]MDD3702900.1 acetate kinase [Victivallaceae bacterium]MDD5662854.1 acetate kinase [Victivallaceae bacterium]